MYINDPLTSKLCTLAGLVRCRCQGGRQPTPPQDGLVCAHPTLRAQPTQGLEALSAMETPAVPEHPVVRHRLSPFRGRGQLSLFGFVAGRETHSGEIDG